MASNQHLITLILQAVDEISPVAGRASKSLENLQKKANDLSKKQEDNDKKQTKASKERQAAAEKALQTEIDGLKELNKEEEDWINLSKQKLRLTKDRQGGGAYSSKDLAGLKIREKDGFWSVYFGGKEEAVRDSLKDAREAALLIQQEVAKAQSNSPDLRKRQKTQKDYIEREIAAAVEVVKATTKINDAAEAERVSKEAIASAKRKQAHTEEEETKSKETIDIGRKTNIEVEKDRVKSSKNANEKILTDIELSVAKFSKKAGSHNRSISLIDYDREIKKLNNLIAVAKEGGATNADLKPYTDRVRVLRSERALLAQNNKEQGLIEDSILGEIESRKESLSLSEKQSESARRALVFNKERSKLQREYIQALEKERNYIDNNNDALDVSNAKQKEMRSNIELMRHDLKEIGVNYEEIDKNFDARIKKQKEENDLAAKKLEITKRTAQTTSRTKTTTRTTTDRDTSLFKRLKDDNTVLGKLNNTLKNTAREGGALSRKLGRLGLAIRGLAIVGVLSFMRALVATLGALAAAAVAAAGSLVYAASVIGGTLVSAVGQALPILGVLIATMQRLKLIGEAVNQSELAKKNTFGDTGAEDTAIDNANQIADAQDALKEAQDAVTEARKEAAEQLRDLTLAEREAELQLRASILGQSDAQRQLTASIQGGDVESIAGDQLNVDQSRFDVRKSRKDLRDIRGQRKDARRKGIAGSDPVVAAIKGVEDAQRGLAEAHKSAATAANTQVAAERNLDYALSKLTKSEKELYQTFLGFRKRLEKVTKPITDIIIRSFTYALKNVEKLLLDPQILSGFKVLSGAIGDAIKLISDVLTGPAFKQFFMVMIQEASKNMPILTQAFIALAEIFKNIAIGAAPALNRMLRWILGGLEKFADFTSDTGKMDNFFQTGLDHLQAWFDLIGAVLGLFGELMGASSDSQLGVLSDLTDTINGAKDALAADDSGARNYFEDAAKGLSYIGDVIVAIGDAFIQLSGSGHIKALSDVFTKVLIPGVVLGIKMVGVFALFLDKLIEIPLIGHFLKFSVAMAFVAGAGSSMLGIFKPLYVLLKGIGKIIGGIAGRFLNLGGSIDKAVGTIGKDGSKLAKPVSMFEKFLSLFKGKGAIGGIRVFSKALAGIPVAGWIVAAVIEVIIGMITALIENFGGVRDYIVDQFSDVGDVFKDLGESIGDLFGELFGGGGGMDGFKKFLGVLWDIVGAIFSIIGFVGKLVGAFILMTAVNVLIVPLKLIVGFLSTIIKYIANVIGAFRRLFSGEISFGEFVQEIGSAIKGLVTGILGTIGGVIGGIFKGLGNLVFAALREALDAIFGENFGAAIINTVIDIVNWVIDRINDVSPFGNIDKLDKVTPNSELPEDTGGQAKVAGRAAAHEEDAAKARRRNNREKAKGNKLDLDGINLSTQFGGNNKKNIRLNNQLASSLNRTSRAHKQAKNLQQSIIDGNLRARRSQARYADAIERTGRAEARLSKVIGKTKTSRKDYNAVGVHTIGINRKIVNSAEKTDKSQREVNDSITKANLYQARYNLTVARASKYQSNYSGELKGTTTQGRIHATAVSTMSKRYIGLNDVLRATGMNSRALGMVFKTVTNRILTEFNVDPINVQLPKVASMFQDAIGGSSNYQKGGYFGDKKQRGPDDRIIKVAGGEAILTGHQQAAVNQSLAIANKVAGTGVDSLDTLFTKDRRPHASAPAYNNGGTIRAFGNGGMNGNRSANAGGRSIIIPESVPDAQGALPGLDLMAWLANKYFGLGVSPGGGIRAAGTLTQSGNISDHTWGGAVDLSNGSNPTPQMDAAWQWFADVLGGGGSWQESYSGGAIKQMLYRTNIGGNHFNHIHLALQEQYARDTNALTRILTGQAIPVVTGGGTIFAQAPQLEVPRIKGTKGAPKKMLQGQSKKLTDATNKLLKRKIQAAAGGNASYAAPTTVAIDPGSKIQTGFTVYNDPAPGAYGGSLDDGYAELGTATVNGLTGGGYLAQALGISGELPENFPFDVQINGRKKRLYKRDRGWGQGTNAYGIDIWQDSWPFWGLNAMSGGTAVLTAANRVSGQPGAHQRGGKIPEFNDGGIVPGKLGQPMYVKAHGGETILPTHKYQSGGYAPYAPPQNKNKKGRETAIKFKGNTYDVSKAGDLILLISDRINYFVSEIELNLAKLAIQTSKWKYAVKKVGGKEVISRVRSAQQEAERTLKDLLSEYKDIQRAILEARTAANKSKQKIESTKNKYNKEIRKLENKLEKTDKESEKKAIQKEIDKAKTNRKDDLEKFRASLKKSNNKMAELQQQRQDNIVARYEAQLQVFDEMTSRYDQRIEMRDTQIKIAELQNQDAEGELTQAGKSKVRGLYTQRGSILREERGDINRALSKATKAKDVEEIRRLKQALLDNELALLENNQSIKDLDDSVKDNTDTFTFKTTSWELFRNAVLNGSGQILPEFTSSIPQLASGGYIKSDGMAYLHAAEVVVPANRVGTSNGGPMVDTINFTQPLEVADPIAVSNQIGFKLSTMKSV